MSAALYAIDTAGEKFFYELAAKKAIKMLRSSISLRAIFLRRPDISVLHILASTFVVCLIVGSPILLMFGQIMAAASLAVVVPLWWYALIFPFVSFRKYMDVDEMDLAMKNGGFTSLIEVSKKAITEIKKSNQNPSKTLMF